MWKPSPTPDDVIMHSAKGSSWKKHKYIAIKNGKYIYPGDNKPSSTAKNRYKMKEQSKNMKYNELGEAHDAYLKDGGTYGENFKKSEINAKRHKMPTGAADAARTNYLNQKETVENIGHSPAAYLRGVKTENYLKVLKKKADQSSAAAYGFREKASNQNKRVTDTGDKSSREANKKRRAQEIATKSHEIRRKQKANKEIKDAKTTGDREWARRNKALTVDRDYDAAKKHEKNSRRADITYSEGKMRGYDNNKYEKRKGKKVTNPTAKKNQRKAALEKAKYKAKKILTKPFKKSTKRTVTDTFTNKSRTVSNSNSINTINIKQFAKKNKKRR